MNINIPFGFFKFYFLGHVVNTVSVKLLGTDE